MNENEKHDIYLKEIEAFGANDRKRLAVEKMQDLSFEMKAVYRDEAYGASCVANEIANVEIMLEQLKILYGINNFVSEQKEFKLQLLKKRLEQKNMK